MYPNLAGIIEIAALVEKFRLFLLPTHELCGDSVAHPNKTIDTWSHTSSLEGAEGFLLQID